MLGNTEGYANHDLALLDLQKDFPGLWLDVRPNLNGEYVLMPKDDDSTARMCTIAIKRDPAVRMVMLVKLDPVERRVKMVLKR